MKNKKQQYLYSLLSGVLFMVGNANAALPIEECKTFLAEELELLCLQSSIAARIEDELPYSFSTVRYDYDNADIEFRAQR